MPYHSTYLFSFLLGVLLLLGRNVRGHEELCEEEKQSEDVEEVRHGDVAGELRVGREDQVQCLQVHCGELDHLAL